jgi:hypothetical protein
MINRLDARRERTLAALCFVDCRRREFGDGGDLILGWTLDVLVQLDHVTLLRDSIDHLRSPAATVTGTFEGDITSGFDITQIYVGHTCHTYFICL